MLGFKKVYDSKLKLKLSIFERRKQAQGRQASRNPGIPSNELGRSRSKEGTSMDCNLTKCSGPLPIASCKLDSAVRLYGYTVYVYKVVEHCITLQSYSIMSSSTATISRSGAKCMAFCCLLHKFHSNSVVTLHCISCHRRTPWPTPNDLFFVFARP